MIRLLLDTDVLSQLMRGKNARVASQLAAHFADRDRIAICSITVIEVVAGFQARGHTARLHRFLNRLDDMDVWPIDTPTAVLGGQIIAELQRRGTPIGWADPLIAAVAIRHELTLLTGNARHYARIREIGQPLQFENWSAQR
ncbi:MAG: PIN domain-containing protein [Phycisphaerae bacterium]